MHLQNHLMRKLKPLEHSQGGEKYRILPVQID